MNLCYIILAHDRINDVVRLIDRLNFQDTSFVVHIDIKCNEDLSPIKKYSNVRLLHSYDIRWGGISQIEALNYCCEEALKLKSDYFVLLSGSDYPVKSAQYIHRYFESHSKYNFIEGLRLPNSKCSWAEGGRRRTECYALVLNRRVASIEPRRFDYHNFRELAKVLVSGSNYINALKIFFSFPKRKNTSGIVPHGGEFWWRLNRESLQRITDYRKEHPEYHEWQKWTANCDELYYHSLAYDLCKNNIPKILTFVNWGG